MKQSLIFLGVMFASCACVAQEASFKLLRYDENYTYLAKDTTNNWYNHLKFKPLSADKNDYLSIGGEVRYQYFHFNNQDWGATPADNDGFVLTRYLAHADLHTGKYFRAFVQLQSSLANGEPVTPSPVDNDPLEIHQAFADLMLPVSKDENLTLRLGRQELAYGSQRLISVREGPNNRHSFDGAKLMLNAPNQKFDLFYTNYVQARPGIFDDGFNTDMRLWGAYAAFNKVLVIKNLDLYYLGFWKKSAVFNDGVGRELRHSVGTHVWATGPAWQYDLEAVYQFGKFADKTIAAWTASSNISYTFSNQKLKPQLGFKTELISGDRQQGDDRLNTFNPLFPRGAYFGLAALIGPYNLIDTHPYIQFSLSKSLVFATDYDMFWRMDGADGLYAMSGKLIYPAGNNFSKQIGKQLGTSLEYTPNKFLYFRQELTWFSAGDFLKASGPGKDILMLGSTITLKF